MDLKGNKDWSWVSKLQSEQRPEFWTDCEPVNKQEYQIFKYIRYIIKGNKDNIKYVHNIPQSFIDKCLSDWEPTAIKVEKITVIEKQKKIPYQQDVISGATAEWYKYKKECSDNEMLPDKKKIIEFVCNEMRRVSKGINPYLVKELANAVLFDDLDYREVILDRIKSTF